MITRYMRDMDSNLHQHKDGDLVFYTDVQKLETKLAQAREDLGKFGSHHYTKCERDGCICGLEKARNSK